MIKLRHFGTRKNRLPRYVRAWPALVAMALFAAVGLWRPFAAPDGPDLSQTGLVTTVIDGDTIRLADGRRVRYIGIDSPEMDSPSDAARQIANRAKAFNTELVDAKEVRLEFDVEKKDRYGRTLAYVWVAGKLANAELVNAGLARAHTYGANRKHADKLTNLEQTAKTARKGIWADTPPR